MSTPLLFSYRRKLYLGDTDTQKRRRPFCKSENVRTIIWNLYRDFDVGPVKRLSFSGSTAESDWQVGITCDPQAISKGWFDYCFPRLVDRMEAGLTLALASVALLRYIDWDDSGSYDWFCSDYITWKLPGAVGLAPIIYKLADGIEKNTEETAEIRPIYVEKFGGHGMSFEFAEAAWLQYVDYSKTSVV